MPDKTKQYKTYEELFAAFRNGELKEYVLVLDNDNCSLRYIGKDMNEEDAYAHCEPLFRGEGAFDFVEMLQAAGIPCESV